MVHPDIIPKYFNIALSSYCNVIKLYNQLHDVSNLIGTISYHNSSKGYLVICHLTYLTF